MKKFGMMLGTLTLACGLLVGCGKAETTTETTTEATTEAVVTEATPAEATPAEAEEELAVIGKEADDAIKTKLENKTGKDITAIAIKNTEDDTWSDNLLEEEDVFTDKEKRYLYYTPEEKESEAENEADEMLTYEGYDIQLTFADETIAVLHEVSLQDVKDAEILVADEVCYLSYISIANDKKTDTKDAELAIKEQEAADAAAQQVVTEAPIVTEAPATEAPATEAPAPAPADGGDDDECLGDGLTY